MKKSSTVGLEPRKVPSQRRSLATVASIEKATIQVLLRKGPERLTTVHVARSAGVSVGTLYQYFPNKQSLLFAILEHHLTQVADSLEKACCANHGQPLERMLSEMVKRFIEAKLAERHVAVALYRIAGELGGDLIVDRFRNRCEKAISAMLESALMEKFSDTHFVAQMVFLTMAGVLRGYLEQSAPIHSQKKLKEQLTKLLYSYCSAV